MGEYEIGTGLYNETIEIDFVHHLAPNHSRTLCGLPIRPEDEGYIMEDQFIEDVTCGICKAKWMDKHGEESKEW